MTRITLIFATEMEENKDIHILVVDDEEDL